MAPEPKIERKLQPTFLGISVGQWATISLLVIGGAVTWGEMRSNAQQTKDRVDKLERNIDENRNARDQIKEKLNDVDGTVKQLNERSQSQQRSLDRIERLLDRRERTGSPP